MELVENNLVTANGTLGQDQKSVIPGTNQLFPFIY